MPFRRHHRTSPFDLRSSSARNRPVRGKVALHMGSCGSKDSVAGEAIGGSTAKTPDSGAEIMVSWAWADFRRSGIFMTSSCYGKTDPRLVCTGSHGTILDLPSSKERKRPKRPKGSSTAATSLDLRSWTSKDGVSFQPTEEEKGEGSGSASSSGK